jgi:hypothetical protein
LFWNDVSFVPVRVLHKDEKILGQKHIYLPHAQTAIYDSKVKLFLKQGISHQLGRDAVVRFECENSAIDVIINFYEKYYTSLSTFSPPLIFGGFSNFCRYYTRSQTGKSTGYRPTLKPLYMHIFLSNYWWQRSDIWSQASYRYPISWEVFFDLSDSDFLFAKERGYHRWALAHSSSCLICVNYWSIKDAN